MISPENLKRFYELLQFRLELGVHTTEDSIRYTFFAALLDASDFEPHEFVQEYPHPSRARAKIDTVIKHNGLDMAIEFKYHRRLPGGKNAPRPEWMGSVFNDVSRLVDSQMHALIIHVADDEIGNYLRNPQNGLAHYAACKPGSEITIDHAFFVGKSNSFVKKSGGEFEARIRCLQSQTLPRKHELRVFEVLQLQT